MTNNDLLDLETDDLSLLETLDHALNRGLVIAGDITISVADIDLVFIGLNLLVGSIETIQRVLEKRERKTVMSDEPLPLLPERRSDG